MRAIDQLYERLHYCNDNKIPIGGYFVTSTRGQGKPKNAGVGTVIVMDCAFVHFIIRFKQDLERVPKLPPSLFVRPYLRDINGITPEKLLSDAWAVVDELLGQVRIDNDQPIHRMDHTVLM
ncbi:hypothetical protein ACAW74_21145 [Fibrella sp. WM1]|uniref:hypothetical protein n=1 Tax=Fibrella musci TaxID=3242485 RepID=UPI003521DB1B